MNASTTNLLPETSTAPLPMSMNRASSVTVLNRNMTFRRLSSKVNGVDKINIPAELSKVPTGNGFHFAIQKGWRLGTTVPQLIDCKFRLQTKDCYFIQCPMQIVAFG